MKVCARNPGPSGQSAHSLLCPQERPAVSCDTRHQPPSQLVLFSARCSFCYPPNLPNASDQRVTRYTLLGPPAWCGPPSPPAPPGFHSRGRTNSRRFFRKLQWSQPDDLTEEDFSDRLPAG